MNKVVIRLYDNLRTWIEEAQDEIGMTIVILGITKWSCSPNHKRCELILCFITRS